MVGIFEEFKDLFESSNVGEFKSSVVKNKTFFTPTSENAIKVFELKNRITFPEDFKSLYRKSNGVSIAYIDGKDISFIYDEILVCGRTFQSESGLECLMYLPDDKLTSDGIGLAEPVEFNYPADFEYEGLEDRPPKDKAKMLSNLLFEEWPKEDQDCYSWWEGWDPAKKTKYLIIGGTSLDSQHLLMGIAEDNHGKIYVWDRNADLEKYNPFFVADSLYAFFASFKIEDL